MPSVCIGVLPSLDPRETVFSWGAKARISLAVSARRLSMTVFENVRAGHLHELPTSLTSLISRTGTSFGTVSDLVRRHTVFGSYMALLDEERSSAFERAVLDGKTLRGHMLLGLRASTLGARHPLRYCYECADTDRRRLGYSRWLVEQQLPGAWLCRTHGTALIELQALERPWQLPIDEANRPAPRLKYHNAHSLEIATNVSAELFGSKGIKSVRLADAALAQLVHNRVVGNPARLNEMDIHSAFLKSQIASFLASEDRVESALLGDRAWVVNLIRNRHATHPAKWAILWAWLWESESLPDALAAFRHAVGGEFHESGQLQASLWPTTVDAGTDISIRRIHEAMLVSTTLTEVATHASLPRGVLGRWMRAHASLRALWSARQHDLRRTYVARALEYAIRAGGFSDRSDFILQNRARVHWLRKHDPSAMSLVLAGIPPLRSKQRRLF